MGTIKTWWLTVGAQRDSVWPRVDGVSSWTGLGRSLVLGMTVESKYLPIICDQGRKQPRVYVMERPEKWHRMISIKLDHLNNAWSYFKSTTLPTLRSQQLASSLATFPPTMLALWHGSGSWQLSCSIWHLNSCLCCFLSTFSSILEISGRYSSRFPVLPYRFIASIYLNQYCQK